VVDWSVRFRQPQLHTVLLEQHGQVQELVAVESPLILTDHHGIEQVRLLAATCLGHVARVYRQLDEKRVVPVLRRMGATTALEDIEVFLHPRRTRWRVRLWRVLRPWVWF
jgi:hypothetical protein